jgi:serine phosphatase RsbU (regulator of sigma subunit)
MNSTIRLLFALLLIFLSVLIFPQARKITIIAESNNVPENSDIYITGGTNELGNWNMMEKMEKLSSDKWSYKVSAEEGDTLHFKFTRGSWRTEAVDSNGIEFPDFSYAVTEDTALIYLLPNWRDKLKNEVVISPERLKNKNGNLELYAGWKYKTGDDTLWADPNYNDNEWKPIANPYLNNNDFKKMVWDSGKGWPGKVWFRNHIIVDSALRNKPFAFSFFNTGAAEVYLDGKLLYKYGEIGKSIETEKPYFDRNPRHIIFSAKENHVLAVRYSNLLAEEQSKYNVPTGFNAVLGEPDMFFSNRISEVREITLQQLGFGAFLLAFAIMHLLIFIFYPKTKENLFYSISMLSFAVVVYTSMQADFIHTVLSAINLSIINSASVQISLLFGLLTVYASSYSKMPKQYLVFVLISALFILHTIFSPLLGNPYIGYAFYFFGLIITLEIFRIVVRAIRRKESWGWLIGAGFLVAILFIIYQVLISMDVIRPLFGIYLVYVYGIVFLAITVSIHLSRRIAYTNKNLEKQLIQIKELSQKALEQERRAKDEEISRKLLEADNTRKTEELEEARKLQYSMLPRVVPPVPNLDIAVYMKPATEVGGDYYDFKYNNNGSLTIAVGDATGHGMRAGTLVAAIKGLFTAESFNTDILTFFNKCNFIIREMQLGNLYMAMMMAKIENNKMVISSAGMPPALIYRRKEKQVEEIRIKGMPLGGSPDFPYAKKEAPLFQGDTLLLMSDGFPELFNKQKEILDYKNVTEIFCSVAEKPSKKIIEELNIAAEKWMDGADQQDDITFVVVKVK